MRIKKPSETFDLPVARTLRKLVFDIRDARSG